MTYGQLKFRLAKAFPGVDADLIEGWIADRYAEILGELPWSRQDTVGVLLTVAPYSTGAVQLTQGSATVTVSGGAFASEMTGRALRATGRDEFYEFTYTSAGTGTLDRVYEGPTNAAAGYSIFQSVYPLPADCRMLRDDAFGGMERMSHGQMNASFPTRSTTGTPRAWAVYMDDSSVPPRMQVEVYPIPDTAAGISFSYVADAAPWVTSTAPLLTWMQPAALVEGVTARIKAHLKDYAGAQIHALAAQRALANMRTSEAQGMGPTEMQLGGHYTSHRARRWCR